MSNSITPSAKLYDHVRAGFIAQGTTLTAFCRERNVAPANARCALVGSWNGPRAKRLRQELVDGSGINFPQKLLA